MSDVVQEFLSASLQEQMPVTIYFGSHRLTGTVTGIKEDTVEIRHEKNRCVIFLRKIYAVSRE
jgi:sRNA-binding regulator protein Hfq